ncbi:AraC family transcriptional regulator, partial [Paenibacillus sepulcri]|nr:AraC family transcriptional regulator [Paenibacillus sepulcri]
IAGKVGIPDYNYFIRVFRKQTGQAPGAYRRERQGFV